MFSIFGGAETRRLPGRFQVPWKEILLVVIALIVAAGIYGVWVSRASENTSAPALRDTSEQAVPGVSQPAVMPAKLEVPAVWQLVAVPAVSQPVTQPFDTSQDLRPVQQVSAPFVKEWPKVEVVWSKPFLINSLADLPPSLPAGKGFYGEKDTSGGTTGAHSSEEAYAFAKKIFGSLNPANTAPVIGGVARDPTNPNVVFAGIDVSKDFSKGIPVRDPSQEHFFLSTDGEKTWIEISLIYPDRSNGGTFNVRVVQEGDIVTLFARDSDFVAPMWRKATLSLKSLP